jgi:putative hydrolases of HD superfamily
MENINKFRLINKLKSVYRENSVENRKESSAEHSWSCLILADYFLSNMSQKLDRLKIYELLMYHDVVEIYAGDTPLHPINESADKKQRENESIKLLEKDLPSPINKKLVILFKEFEEMTTMEAKFAKAIDALDAQIHEMDYKKDWKGWSKQFLIDKKANYFKDFPELRKSFEELLIFLETNDYFNQ